MTILRASLAVIGGSGLNSLYSVRHLAPANPFCPSLHALAIAGAGDEVIAQIDDDYLAVKLIAPVEVGAVLTRRPQ